MGKVIIENANVYTCNGPSSNKLGLIEDATVVFENGKLVYMGESVGLGVTEQDVLIDGTDKIVMPGLVDCHTHTVFAGSRSEEFMQKLSGVSYSAILEAGGGILSTVKSTRLATKGSLAEVAKERVTIMKDIFGVTTVEIKSGYGLSTDDEFKMLQAAQECNGVVRVFPTYLAHTFPAEMREKREEYVRQVIEEQIPKCAPLAKFIDIFCDRGAFNLQEAERILAAGKQAGLTVRAHAEQIESTGCAQLVAKLGGTSADHLERLTEEGAVEMGKAGVVAVLLPGAQLYLKDTSPPVPLLRQHNVKMAVATDFNPGSSPVLSLWACATLATLTQGLTVEEAVLGITKHAGEALGRSDLGHLTVNSSVADCIIISPPPGEPPRVESLIQFGLGGPQVDLVIQNGEITFTRSHISTS